MNVTRGEKLIKLQYALETGASLNEAARHAGVTKQTALRWRLIWKFPANRQDRWREWSEVHGVKRLSANKT